MLVAIQRLRRTVIVNLEDDIAERNPFFQKFRADLLESRPVQQTGFLVTVQVRILGGKVNEQDGKDAEIAGDKRVDKLLSQYDAGDKHQVVANHTRLQTDICLLPAQEYAEQ